ncbi:MAG: translation initiation factor IF-2 N-terminal domain-containing protein, partial [Desulfobacterales bacterium]
MAKIRIHELARELNMQNKELLEKLSDMDIDAKSHMSSLDDDTVTQIRGLLLGKKVAVVEETRVKQTVIRRRRKVVKVETPPQEAAPEPAVSDETAVDAQEAEAEEKAPKKAARKKAAEVGPEPEAEKKVTRKKTKATEVEAVKETDAEAEKEPKT